MRLIDADALEKGLVNLRCGEDDEPSVLTRAGMAIYDAAIDMAIIALHEAEPVDAEPVVRCKDCMHFNPYIGEEHKGDCMELIGLESCVYEDDYCSYGERR